MLKSRCGIVAALAFLCCGSQSEAADGSSSKLMADLPKSQGPEWVLYEELPEDGEIVSFDNAGDTEGAFEICQSEAGAVGTIAETTQGSLVCRTASGANDSFYVLQLAVGADDGEAGDLDSSIKMTLELEQPEMGEATSLLQFEFTDEEREEIGEAIAETDAIKRMTEECASADRPDTCGPKPKQGMSGESCGFWGSFFGSIGLMQGGEVCGGKRR